MSKARIDVGFHGSLAGYKYTADYINSLDQAITQEKRRKKHSGGKWNIDGVPVSVDCPSHVGFFYADGCGGYLEVTYTFHSHGALRIQISNLESLNLIEKAINRNEFAEFVVKNRNGKNLNFYNIPDEKLEELFPKLSKKCHAELSQDGKYLVLYGEEALRDDKGEIIEFAYSSNGNIDEPTYMEECPQLLKAQKAWAEEVMPSLGLKKGLEYEILHITEESKERETIRGQMTSDMTPDEKAMQMIKENPDVAMSYNGWLEVAPVAIEMEKALVDLERGKADIATLETKLGKEAVAGLITAYENNVKPSIEKLQSQLTDKGIKITPPTQG